MLVFLFRNCRDQFDLQLQFQGVVIIAVFRCVNHSKTRLTTHCCIRIFPCEMLRQCNIFQASTTFRLQRRDCHLRICLFDDPGNSHRIRAKILPSNTRRYGNGVSTGIRSRSACDLHCLRIIPAYFGDLLLTVIHVRSGNRQFRLFRIQAIIVDIMIGIDLERVHVHDRHGDSLCNSSITEICITSVLPDVCIVIYTTTGSVHFFLEVWNIRLIDNIQTRYLFCNLFKLQSRQQSFAQFYNDLITRFFHLALESKNHFLQNLRVCHRRHKQIIDNRQIDPIQIVRNILVYVIQEIFRLFLCIRSIGSISIKGDHHI